MSSTVLPQWGIAMRCLCLLAGVLATRPTIGQAQLAPNLHYDGRITAARLRYTPVAHPDAGQGADSPVGAGWGHNYPMSVHGLLTAVKELTATTDIVTDSNLVLTVENTAFTKHPIVMLTEPRCWNPTDAEATALRTYLLKDGFLIADDFTFGRTSLSPNTRVTAFVDVSVIPMDRERVLPHHTVLVQDGRITALGPRAQVRVPTGAVRIDGRGKFLLPGLADMHTHLAYAAQFDTTGDPAVPLAEAEQQLFLLLANGVTTIRNLDFMATNEPGLFGKGPVLDGPTLLQLKARAASGELWSPRIYTSSKWRLDTTKSVDENMATYKAAGYDHLKMYRDQDDPILRDSLVRAAHRVGMPLVAHGFDGDVWATLALGLKSAEHLVPYWGTHPDSLAPLLAATTQAGLWNSPTTGLMIINNDGGGTHTTPLERRYRAKAFAQMRRGWLDPKPVVMPNEAAPLRVDTTTEQSRVIRGLQHAGAGLLLGSDMASHLADPGFSVHRGLQAFVVYGLTPYQALVTGTRNVAAYFGTEDSTGTVAVGKRADLLLLEANPLVDIRHTGKIAGVMIGGRWLSRAAIEQRLDATYGHVGKPGTPEARPDRAADPVGDPATPITP